MRADAMDGDERGDGGKGVVDCDDEDEAADDVDSSIHSSIHQLELVLGVVGDVNRMDPDW
jgi:hypothetical protein